MKQTDAVGARSLCPRHLRDKLFGVGSQLDDVVEVRKEWSERERSAEQSHEQTGPLQTKKCITSASKVHIGDGKTKLGPRLNKKPSSCWGWLRDRLQTTP